MRFNEQGNKVKTFQTSLALAREYDKRYKHKGRSW